MVLGRDHTYPVPEGEGGKGIDKNTVYEWVLCKFLILQVGISGTDRRALKWRKKNQWEERDFFFFFFLLLIGSFFSIFVVSDPKCNYDWKLSFFFLMREAACVCQSIRRSICLSVHPLVGPSIRPNPRKSMEINENRGRPCVHNSITSSLKSTKINGNHWKSTQSSHEEASFDYKERSTVRSL